MKIKVIIGLLLSLISFVIVDFYYHSITAASFFVLLFIVGIIINTWNPSKRFSTMQTKAVNMIWVLFTCFVTVVLVQLIMDQNIFWIDFLRILLNSLIVLFVIMVFFFFTLKPYLSSFFGSLVLIFFTTVNHFIYVFRGNELVPADLLSIKTAANVASEYSIVPTKLMVYTYILYAAYFYISLIVPKTEISKRLRVRQASIILNVFIALSIAVSSLFINTNHFLNTGSYSNGFLLNFTLLAKEMFVKKPSEYSMTYVENIQKDYISIDSIKSDKNPDIIVIMDESFADLSVFGSNIKTTSIHLFN